MKEIYKITLLETNMDAFLILTWKIVDDEPIKILVGESYVFENVKFMIWNVTVKCKGIITIETTSKTRIHSDIELDDDLSVESFEDNQDLYLSLEERKDTIMMLKEWESKQIQE